MYQYISYGSLVTYILNDFGYMIWRADSSLCYLIQMINIALSCPILAPVLEWNLHLIFSIIYLTKLYNNIA